MQEGGTKNVRTYFMVAPFGGIGEEKGPLIRKTGSESNIIEVTLRRFDLNGVPRVLQTQKMAHKNQMLKNIGNF